MRRRILAAVLIVMASGTAATWAAAPEDFDRGMTLYRSGKKSEAVPWFLKAAEQGGRRQPDRAGVDL
ncbi:MAG: hypothetical protein WDO24_02285 [Pseudomonadota bacterium]